MTRYAIIIFWSDADGAWIADAPDLKSCSALGDTPQEAAAELTVAMEAWLAAASDAGHALPEPRFHPQREAAE
jgi:predicted RNase H-like HicB family nuclease